MAPFEVPTITLVGATSTSITFSDLVNCVAGSEPGVTDVDEGPSPIIVLDATASDTVGVASWPSGYAPGDRIQMVAASVTQITPVDGRKVLADSEVVGS